MVPVQDDARLTVANPSKCHTDHYTHILIVPRLHSQYRPLPTLDAAKTFAVAIVSSRLDYCNSLLQGTSAANLDRLQRVQDVLARVVAQAPWSVSSTDLRRDFHWLSIEQRIVYRQCLMTYKAIHIGQPNYLNPTSLLEH